jgi:hypothetical protein
VFVTRKTASAFDPSRVIDPEKRGGVAWSQFNESFETLQHTDWRRINEGKRHSLPMRLLRHWMALAAQKRRAILDLEGKARAFAKLPIPRDPDVVFFGAEAGWEGSIVQALFGDRGRLVLIDNDPAAYQRFLAAPEEITIRAPKSHGEPELVIRRDKSRIEYVQQDYFDVDLPKSFDVGIDWGIIEHYDDQRKLAVMKNFQRFIKDGGVEVSSCPRDTLAVRAFYFAFREEMNFGYRELMTLEEFEGHLRRGGYEIIRSFTLTAHNIAACRIAAG